jgi:hypothetical protein
MRDKDSTPQERLAISRSDIVKLMQEDNQILHALKPIVTHYVKSHPKQMLGMAAGIGAAMVIFYLTLRTKP